MHDTAYLSSAVPRSGVLVLLAALMGTPCLSSQPAREEIYDTKANAKSQIAAALRKAKRDNKRVLLMFGGNWCGWCHKLHDVFQKESSIRRLLRYEFELVLVDVGRFDRHMDIAKAYGADLKKHGVPFLTVLRADGKALANQNTGDLEIGPRHDLDKVKALLQKWVPEPVDAEQVLKRSLSLATKQKKMVLVHLGAPW